jgi:hypothetical protein
MHECKGLGFRINKNKGVSYCGLAIYIKKVSFLRQKKNYENSNNFTMQKNIIFKKIPLKSNSKSFKILLGLH